MADSSNVSVSASNSTSFIPGYSEEPFLAQLAQYQQQLEQNQYAWAQQQFQQNSTLSNQVINSYLQSSAQAYGQSVTDMARYNQLFAPENAQLVQDANTYASSPRQAEMMGAAESTNAQNFAGQRDAALKDLEGFGIDPSAGRYEGLNQAERTQQAAAGAGAANQAQLATTATGQNLRQQAIQVGETLPGQSINELNASMQGQAGAENTALANAASGLAMLTAPAQYGALGMSLKYPPLGTTSKSGSGSSGQSSSPSNQGNQSGQSNQPAFNGSNPGAYPVNNTRPTSPGGAWSSSGQPGSGVQNVQPGSGAVDTGDNWGSGAQDYTNPGNPYGLNNDYMSGMVNEFNQPDLSPGGAYEGGLSSDNLNAPNYNNGNMGDPWAALDSSIQGLDSSIQNYSNASADQGQSYGDAYSSNYDQSSGSSSDYGSYDSGSTDYSGDFGGDYSAAAGGAIGGYAAGGAPTSGGAVGKNLSPSNGARTDDIPARLNADEFVIPRDVHKWKGEEFFHNLIAQSRKKRQDMVAQSGAVPTMRPSLNQAPAFRSGAIG